jgi:hypothetical protein
MISTVAINDAYSKDDKHGEMFGDTDGDGRMTQYVKGTKGGRVYSYI